VDRRLRLRDRKADLADAVAASCAIPGFYRPVAIGGSRYVDGGIRSTSNLDVLRGHGLDLVICLNPTSSLHPMRAAVSPSAAVRLMMNRESGRRLGSEAKKLRAEGTDVVLIQPTRDDLAVMGNNLMSGRRRNEAIAMARKTVAAQLRDPRHAELLEALPEGAPEKVRRPDEQPSRWPRLSELRDRVARRSNGAGREGSASSRSGRA
jgi:NTE family protein